MPSNIVITASANSTPPASTVVATCQLAGGQHVQQFMLTDGAGVAVVDSASRLLTAACVINSPSVIVSSGSAVVTNQVSASISNSPSVVVASGSVVVTNQVSASISNSPSVVVSSGSLVVTNSLSASISNSPSVVVSSGSVVVTNALSASISNNLTASAVQSTPTGISNAWPIKITDGTDTVSVTAASLLQVAISAASVNIVDTAGNQYGISTASPLFITGGASGGTSLNDRTAYAEGTTSFTPVGGFFFDAAASLTACQSGAARMTPSRGIHVNLRDNDGSQLGAGTGSPLYSSVTNRAGSAAGSPLFVSVTNSPSVVVSSGSVVVTNSVSASISNSPSVIVSSGSVVVTNALSASISNSPSVVVSSGSLVVTNLLSASISNSPSVVVSSGSIVVTNLLSASISNSPSVIVSSGSVVVTNLQSASVSNFPTLADKATFSEGTTVATPIQGLMLNTTACLTASQVGAVRINEWRAQHVTIRTASGNELGAGSASPLFASVTNSVSASISNSPSVIVSSGSVVVTNALSASVSGGSVALLAGANVVGSASVIQGTPTGVANAWPVTLANSGSAYGISGSPLVVAQDVKNLWFAGSLVAASTLNLSASVSGCTRIVASAAGKAILVLAATYVTSNSQNIGWVASGAGAASALIQSPMPFAQFGGMDANRHPHTLWEFPSGSNAVLTTTSACIVAGTITYVQVAS